MAKVTLSDALRGQYETLFNTCVILSRRLGAAEAIVGKILENRSRYEAVEAAQGVPWFVVAVIHSMEASLSFRHHLHNGDPLTARTVHVPAGRPKQGSPPFTWEESAADALSLRHLGADTDWSLGGTLYQIEGYNGWGYRLYHKHVLSPYLWSFSNHYTSGKYVADGTWSDTAKSQQCGAAVLLRRMAEQGEIAFAGQPVPPAEAEPLVVRYALSRSNDPAMAGRAEDLQRWLNTYPGIFVKVDGAPGPSTSAAYRRVTGYYLPGDPRAA